MKKILKDTIILSVVAGVGFVTGNKLAKKRENNLEKEYNMLQKAQDKTIKEIEKLKDKTEKLKGKIKNIKKEGS